MTYILEVMITDRMAGAVTYLNSLFEHFIPLNSRQFLKYLTAET